MNAIELLDELLAQGAIVEARGEKLHIEAPAVILTPEVRDALRTLKPEVLAVLRERTLPLGSGCELHSVGGDAVEERWQQAETQSEAAAVCACCGGPCRDGEIACSRCEPLAPDQEAELERPPPCVGCGAPGYTCNAALEWRCEPCSRRLHATEEAGAA